MTAVILYRLTVNKIHTIKLYPKKYVKKFTIVLVPRLSDMIINGLVSKKQHLSAEVS